ncbi:MAG: hypothetical protein R3C41_18135 [Calditrichia bacterium]
MRMVNSFPGISRDPAYDDFISHEGASTPTGNSSGAQRHWLSFW